MYQNERIIQVLLRLWPRCEAEDYGAPACNELALWRYRTRVDVGVLCDNCIELVLPNRDKGVEELEDADLIREESARKKNQR